MIVVQLYPKAIFSFKHLTLKVMTKRERKIHKIQ